MGSVPFGWFFAKTGNRTEITVRFDFVSVFIRFGFSRFGFGLVPFFFSFFFSPCSSSYPAAKKKFIRKQLPASFKEV